MAFYVTTPIYYVNDVPHLGHAYTTIVADALARFHRLRGEDVRFLTGTDEHGLKIERAAAERGVTPKAFVDELSGVFRRAFADPGNPLGCTPDDFIRTTDAHHAARVQDLWRRCRERGFIYEGTYEGLYCVGCEGYYTEKELEPSPDGLVCPTHRKPVERVKEPTYFFKLSAMQQPLLDWYRDHPDFVAPESRKNEVVSFVRAGLQDLSISRTSFKWGIHVPDDPKHVVYVWFDALTNYLSALRTDGEVARYWPESVHLVGKDILRFHAIFWPAFLLAAGLPPPRRVWAHGWLTVNGQKMSKSLRNVVEPMKLAATFGADVVRYYLLREVAFGQDGDFSHAQLVARYNSELADSLGNLLNRTLGLCAKLRPAATIDRSAGTIDLEERLEEAARTAVRGFRAAFEEIAPHRAIESAWALCRAANKYVDEAAPWSEAKKGDAGKARVDAILATSLGVLRLLSVVLWPVMPEVSDKIRAQLGEGPLSPRPGEDQLVPDLRFAWDTGKLQAGTPIFPKIDADRQKVLFDELGVSALLASPAVGAVGAAGAKAADHAGAKAEKKPKGIPEPAAEITYEEFARLDLRIGRVVSAERVPKSDKLLKLAVDVGDPAGNRQVVAGIGKTWAPEVLVGRQVVVVANLKPAKLMGLESRGMVLAVSGPEGESDLALLAPDKERVVGTRVK